MMCYSAEMKYCLRAAAAMRIKRWAKRKGGRHRGVGFSQAPHALVRSMHTSSPVCAMFRVVARCSLSTGELVGQAAVHTVGSS